MGSVGQGAAFNSVLVCLTVAQGQVILPPTVGHGLQPQPLTAQAHLVVHAQLGYSSSHQVCHVTRDLVEPTKEAQHELYKHESEVAIAHICGLGHSNLKCDDRLPY